MFVLESAPSCPVGGQFGADLGGGAVGVLDGNLTVALPTLGWVSKTERVLTGDDDAALDELDEFVASEAEAADTAIGELIDDVVDDRTNGDDPADDHHVPDGYGLDVTELQTVADPSGDIPAADNEYHTGEIARPVVDGNGFDTGESERPDVDAVADTPADGNGFDTGETERLVGEAVDDTPASGNGFDTGEVERPVDEATIDTDEVATTAVATAVAVATVTDDEIDETEAEVVAPEIDEAEAEVVAPESDEAEAEVVAPVEADEEVEEESYELPEIIPATADGPDEEESTEPSGEIVAREGDLDEPVSDDIIEELRRADIDGPLVEFAPQDDTTSARRRPKRRPDYDPAPVPIPAKPPRVLGRKPRVRKVTRVVRHVDPWSVFKIAAVANLVLYVILLVAGVLLWNVAYATGTIDNIERFFESFGWSTFEFNGGEIYHAAWIAGLFAAIGFTGLAVLAATMFNLITDIVGGMRFTVLEEEVVETRTSPMRRFVVRRPEPVVPAETEDSTGSLVREAVVDDSSAIERRTR